MDWMLILFFISGLLYIISSLALYHYQMKDRLNNQIKLHEERVRTLTATIKRLKEANNARTK